MTTTRAPVTTPSGNRTDEQFFASRYKQGERTVYGLALSPDEITTLVPRPDPAVVTPGNRRITPSHAEGFARYFIATDNWVIPGVILRAPSIFTFEETTEVPGAQFGLMSYPRRNSGDIHILDGQHRILGFFMALDILSRDIDKARSAKAAARRVGDPNAEKAAQNEIATLEAARDRFFNQRFSVEVQVTDDLKAARQMFFDIADNAKGITASTRARFDSTKAVNRALPVVLEHPLLLERVDMEKDRVQKNSPYWLPASKLVEIIRSIQTGFDGRVSRKLNASWKDEDLRIARETNEFFDLLVATMGPIEALKDGQTTPGKMRETMLLGGQTFIRILAGVYYELRKDRGWSSDQVAEFFTALGPHAATRAHANSIWQLHVPEHIFNLNALGPSGLRSDSAELVNLLVDWAVMRAPFVYAAPVAPPVEVNDPDEGLDFALGHDTTAQAVEQRNEIEALAAKGREKARAAKSE